MVREQPAGVGEADAPPVPGQELLPHLAFQFGHLLGDRGGGDVEAVGRSAHRSVPGEGVQRA